MAKQRIVLKYKTDFAFAPVVDAGPDSTICKGQSLILTPSGAISYVWKNNATLSCTACTNPVAKPATSAKYIVTGKSNFGCFNKDSVSITVVQPFSIVASLRDTICKGQSIILSARATKNTKENVYRFEKIS